MSCERIFVIAGEASGDLHASDLVRHLQELRPEIRVHAVGGERLQEVGAEILVSSSELSVVGLTEVLSHLGPILQAYGKVTRWLETFKPSLLVLVDFPEFNLLVARRAKAIGIPVFYYISPQVWAWRQGRVKKIRRLVDKMAVILPFEKQFYSKLGMDVEFVGHPLLDSVSVSLSREAFFKRFSLPLSERLICLLPGSRTGEIRRHLMLFMDSARLIASRATDVSFCLAMAPGLQKTMVDFIRGEAQDLRTEDGLNIHLVEDAAQDAIAASDLVIAASGTVTLEAAILKVPTIVTYKISPLTYWMGRRLVKVKWISLVNLIAGRQIVPEILQRQADPENLCAQALRLLEDSEERAKMISGLEETVRLLGKPGAAARAAAIAESMLPA